MLADPRSRALVNNFADQWLYLRNLARPRRTCGCSRTSTTTCGRRSGRRRSCSSRASCARIAACSTCCAPNYTFVNERLAKHYGIPNVYGSRFRRVTFGEDSVRGGCCGRAAF